MTPLSGPVALAVARDVFQVLAALFGAYCGEVARLGAVVPVAGCHEAPLLHVLLFGHLGIAAGMFIVTSPILTFIVGLSLLDTVARLVRR